MAAPDNAVQAVIFDLDGVLVDSESLHVEAWKVLFRRHGIEVTEAEYAHGVGMVDVDWIRYLSERRGRVIDPQWWEDAKREVYRGILARNICPFPGAVELVHRLRTAGLRLAVASSSWRENIEAVVEATGLAESFDVLTGKDDVRRHKPDPEPYLITAERLGVVPARCAVIEDSELGILSAKRAGMLCIGITNSLPPERLARADLVVATLEDADTVLAFVRNRGGADG